MLPGGTAAPIPGSNRAAVGPLHQLAAVGPIGPDHRLRGQRPTRRSNTNRAPSRSFVGGMHYRRQEPQASHNVRLRPLQGCPRRYGIAAPSLVYTDPLAVNDGSTGTGCPTLGLSQVGKEGVVGPLPGPILTPGAEVSLSPQRRQVKTMRQGGRSWGSIRQEQPVRTVGIGSRAEGISQGVAFRS